MFSKIRNSPDLSSIPWLPPYQVKRSKQRKRLALRFCPWTGMLTIAVGSKTSKAIMARFVQQNKDWIVAHAPDLTRAPESPLVASVDLAALSMSLKLCYADDPKPMIENKHNLQPSYLYLPYPRDQTEASLLWLRNWLKEKAFQTFSPWLAHLSQQTGLSYHALTIGLHKTRWGSYDQSATINLHAGLLLMPPAIVDYVMIHELCHSLHWDHSAAFWQAVSQHYGPSQEARQYLKKAHHHLPAWAYLSPRELVLGR
tara:strand:+ start:4400 stop:5167 length:768 start_codon:yes stop_codon:yes gene_type:complete